MIYLGLILAALMACAGSAYQGYRMGQDAQIAAQAKADARQAIENQHIAEAVDAANSVMAKAIAELRPRYTTIRQEVQREVNTNTVYRDCRLDAAGMRLVNEALAGAPARAASAAAGEGKLPKADTAGR